MSVELDLLGFTALYNLVAADETDSFEICDKIEEVYSETQALTVMTIAEQGSLATDDTTLKMIHDAREAAKTLLPLMDSIVKEYNGISRQELSVFIHELPQLLVAYSLLYYKTFGFDLVIDTIDKDGFLDLEKNNFNKKVLELTSESPTKVFDIASIITSVLTKFQPYLPEYFLNDEELSDIQDAIFNANLPSNAIAALTPEFITSVLGGGAD